MPQASVLSDADIRRVFRVIETTRYAKEIALHSCSRSTLECASEKLPQ